jgi:tetratricopeptide (TPR) repeat protein
LTVYDKGTRPVAAFSKVESGVTVSFILFENQPGMPPSQECRQDAINPILENLGKSGYGISKRVDGETKNSAGDEIVTTSYLIDIKDKDGHHQHKLFGFAGNQKTCAEIHISGMAGTATEDAAMNALLTEFRPDLAYQPTEIDLFGIASVLFKHAPDMAALYYKSSLDVMPHEARYLTTRRVATDQLVISLGMSGDLKGSRSVAESAVATDPDYPINYYNLACADAEQGNVDGAKEHLKQAFDRRANVLKGESMPDPTIDDSILKLKNDKVFWAFVMTLPQK